MTEPTNPTQPSEPSTSATEPTNPTQPSEPGTTEPVPTEPTQPSEPDTTGTEPTEPTQPSVPDEITTDRVGPDSSDESKARVDDENKLIFALPGNGNEAILGLLGNAPGIKITDKDGRELAGGKPVGTGMRFITADGETYSFIIPMDVNGDGRVNSQDARLTLRAAARLETLEGIYLTAADSDGNGKITASDARKALRAAAKLDIITLR